MCYRVDKGGPIRKYKAKVWVWFRTTVQFNYAMIIDSSLTMGNTMNVDIVVWARSWRVLVLSLIDSLSLELGGMAEEIHYVRNCTLPIKNNEQWLLLLLHLPVSTIFPSLVPIGPTNENSGKVALKLYFEFLFHSSRIHSHIGNFTLLFDKIGSLSNWIARRNYHKGS